MFASFRNSKLVLLLSEPKVAVAFAAMAVLLFMSPFSTGIPKLKPLESTLETGVNPCCSFPCQNGGVCLNFDDGRFACDCVSTGYSGRLCQRPSWGKWLGKLLKPDPETTHAFVSGFPWFWSVVNNIQSLRRFVMAKVLELRLGMLSLPPQFRAGVEYTTVEGFSNHSYYCQTLPPVPIDCPTPMGMTGPKVLPSIKEVVGSLLKRKSTHVYPNELDSNVLFAAFAQHFTHMFFKSDPKGDPTLTWGDHNIFLSHIYGGSLGLERQLRLMKGGLLKSQVIRGEEYPPFTSEVPVQPVLNPKKVKHQFAAGHMLANFLPTTAIWQILYLREHNRVATLLAREHSHWSDERIFQTTKLILIGETLKIVVEDYVQHLSNYNFKLFFDPTLLHDEQVQYQNRIAVEFNILYHWHPLMSDTFKVAGTTYNLKDVFFNGSKVLDYSSRDFVEGMVKSLGGSLRANNHPEVTLKAAEAALRVSRQLRLPPFNEYRKRFNQRPYKTFQEITGGDENLACALRSLYNDVDAIEFFPGMMVEHHRSRAIFGSSMVEIGSPYSLQGIFGNALAAPHLWRPVTFGGDLGFSIVKEASLKKFVCDNLPKPCPVVQFRVPTQEELLDHELSLNKTK